MELAVTVSTVDNTLASSRIYCFKADYSWITINDFASNCSNYFCFTKKNKDSLDDGHSFSVRMNIIAINMMHQWMVLLIFVSQKNIIIFQSLQHTESHGSPGSQRKNIISWSRDIYFCVTKKNYQWNSLDHELIFVSQKKFTKSLVHEITFSSQKNHQFIGPWNYFCLAKKNY